MDRWMDACIDTDACAYALCVFMNLLVANNNGPVLLFVASIPVCKHPPEVPQSSRLCRPHTGHVQRAQVHSSEVWVSGFGVEGFRSLGFQVYRVKGRGGVLFGGGGWKPARGRKQSHEVLYIVALRVHSMLHYLEAEQPS